MTHQVGKMNNYTPDNWGVIKMDNCDEIRYKSLS
jgi:hypothetical protein